MAIVWTITIPLNEHVQSLDHGLAVDNMVSTWDRWLIGRHDEHVTSVEKRRETRLNLPTLWEGPKRRECVGVTPVEV